MAQKKKTSSKSTTTKSATKVTRIKAADARTSTDKKTTKTKKEVAGSPKQVVGTKKQKRTNPLTAFLGYFKGAWIELRQVRWPNRRTTWGLTLAVILFTAFFVVLIVLLDYGFQWIFDQILG